MFFSDRKYDKWKALTESDFVTMFIKTWFAYIAVLREINPNISPFAEDGKARGDKPFLNAYNDGMLTLVRRKLDIDEIAKDLFSFYPVCMKKVIAVFPQYFFQTFYRYNEQFNYTDQTIKHSEEGHLLERWQLSAKTEKRHILKLYLGMSGNLYRRNYNEELKIEIDIRHIVSDAIDDISKDSIVDELTFSKSVYNKILECISQKTSLYITDKISGMTYSDTIKQRIRLGCERMISSLRFIFDYNFRFPHEITPIIIPKNSFAVIEQQPFQQFCLVYDSGQYTNEKRVYDELLLTKGLLWFSGFVYSLRNALFHEIIDPLDVEWQAIFKAAYLILKPITDICVDFLDSIDAINENEDTRISDFIENNSFSCLDSLSTHTTVTEVSDIKINEWTITNGITSIKGTVDVAVNLQFGSDTDNRKGDGLVSDEVINCELLAQLDRNFDIVGDINDGYSIELKIID